jgi:hypothetical protein
MTAHFLFDEFIVEDMGACWFVDRCSEMSASTEVSKIEANFMSFF